MALPFEFFGITTCLRDLLLTLEFENVYVFLSAELVRRAQLVVIPHDLGVQMVDLNRKIAVLDTQRLELFELKPICDRCWAG